MLHAEESSNSFIFIHQDVKLCPMSAERLDLYLAEGWRLLGNRWVRHNLSLCREQFCNNIPLRIRLADFELSASQRKTLRRHSRLRTVVRPSSLSPEHAELFGKHCLRFTENHPESLLSFLHNQPDHVPTQGIEHAVYEQDRLVAASYMHLGAEGASSTYCFYDPDCAGYSLGSYTMLREIAWCIEQGMRYYYLGYGYDVPSPFDYKFNFQQLEAYDWATGLWSDCPRMPVRNWRQLLVQTP